MIFFHLLSTWLSDLYITKNCVLCWYTIAEKLKFDFFQWLNRCQFEAEVFNQERLLYCTYSLYRLTFMARIMDNISKQIGSSYDVTIEQMARITTSYYCEKHEVRGFAWNLWYWTNCERKCPPVRHSDVHLNHKSFQMACIYYL